MAFYQFSAEQKIPASVEEIWDFISSPANLKHITPKHMGFEITSGNVPEKMYPGMMISYKVSPVLGLKMDWLTEITQVRDFEYFIDEQRVGPYSLWHHQHKISEIEGGVLMEDLVTYAPPFGPLGALANTFFIKNKLKEIFNFRTLAIENKFGTYAS